MSKSISLAGRPVGAAHPPYIIAEMSGNHNGDFGRALALMEAAKEAGADAVKLQTYTADTMTIDHRSDEFLIKGGLWDGRYLYELYQEAGTPWEWHERLFEKGRELDIAVFSTPFDRTAVDFLGSLNAPAYKIASFELIDLPLIEHVAAQGKPVIISTGMGSLGEMQEAIDALRRFGVEELIVLHCTSGYPVPASDANLRTLPHLAEAFGTIGGLSDHTMGTAVACAAVALGACVIEKHFTLQRSDGGPDAAFSLEPDELKRLVDDTRMAWEALGSVDYALQSCEKGNIIFRRSLYAVRDIAAGEAFTQENVRSIRPGFGMPPKELPNVVGRRAARDIARGTALNWRLLAD